MCESLKKHWQNSLVEPKPGSQGKSKGKKSPRRGRGEAAWDRRDGPGWGTGPLAGLPTTHGCSTLWPQTAPKGPGTPTFFLLGLPGAVGTAWGGAQAQGWADSGQRGRRHLLCQPSRGRW